MLTDDLRQKTALVNIVAGVLFSFSYILLGALYFPFALPPIDSLSDRLLFTWQCCLFASMPLAGGVVAVLARKLLRPNTLDGDPVADGSRLDIHIRFVRDTGPQLLLFVIALFNTAIYLHGIMASFIPVMTSWFIFARLFYWIAYIFNPSQRIFGSVATMAPTLFMLFWSASNLIANTPIAR